MKILYITNIPSPYTVEFLNGLGNFTELTVAFERKRASDRDLQWRNYEDRNYNEIYLKGIPFGAEKAFCFGIVRLLLKDWDVIVISGYATPTGIFAILLLKLIKKNFLISVDGGIIKKDSTIKYQLKKRLMGSATGWLSSGIETSKYLINYGAKKDYIYEFPFSSVSASNINEKAVITRLNKELNNDEKEIKVISVGQFIKRKGFDILLKACANLDNCLKVTIVGGKPTKEYNDLLEQLELENVRFCEFKSKEELGVLYASSDIFVLPTREDIWGLVVNEAMAYGLPVITTDKCVAGATMVVNQENGFVIPVEDEDALAEKINWIAKNDLKRKQMSINALEVAKQYTIEKMVESHIEIFNKFIYKT